MFVRWTASLIVLGSLLPLPACADEPAYDIVVYGGTSGGITAAIQAARLGKTVVLIEPTAHLGGLTSGGLGATDIGNKAAIGGLSRDFYRKVGAYYRQPSAWKHGSLEAYNDGRKGALEEELWMFEPHVAEEIYRQWLAECRVPILRERFELKDGVRKQGSRIVAIKMESGLWIQGRVFIDATYEGDLMAKAGCRYHIGREANSVYGETLNGVQVAHARSHQFIKDVDPYVKPGDPSSGLLPLVQATPPGNDGDGDAHPQAYNFRMCTTDVPENRLDWPKPDGYDPARYELVLRNCEAGDHRIPWNPIFMPNRKTDTNNNFAISTDFIGANYDYPDGDYQTRDRIFREHVLYQMGLMYTLANNPRVPESVRAQFKRLGLAKDEFRDHDNWPHQLYIREARRLISEYVMTQDHCQRRIVCEDPVGMGAYNMDSHNVHRYVTKEGYVRNEGDIQVGVSPYPISYRSIRPQKAECENLLVPVCLAASHIAYGSIRMEPVFMVLGQSAATAASQALDANVAVQDIDYGKLKERLLEDHQVLSWAGPVRTAGIDPKSLPGIVIDDAKAKLTGDWQHSSSIGGYVGTDYLHDGNTDKGNKTVTFVFESTKPGRYDVRIAYTANPNRATNIPISIEAKSVSKSVVLNQREAPKEHGFQTIATLDLKTPEPITIVISNAGTDGYVIVDAVQIAPVTIE
jgi:hypothetical protein